MRFQVVVWGVVAFVMALCSPVRAQSTARISISSAGVQGNDYSELPAVSADGRYVAFHSLASTLVPGDTNDTLDVFVHDRETGTTERVSVASDGTQGNGLSRYAAISADGRYVAFGSDATNLVPGDTNAASDVFVRDRLAGTTERVSLSAVGTQGNMGSTRPSMSADGRYVAFESFADNLVPGDFNGDLDVFVRDRVAGTLELVSRSSSGVHGVFESWMSSISADGRYVAFESWAFNLVPGDTNGVVDVFVRDRFTATTTRVSVASGGTQGDDWSFAPRISGDGRFILFASSATNLVTGDSNGAADTFVRDRVLGTTERVSVNSAGAQGDGTSASAWPWISPEGRYVAFESVAMNLVLGDTNSTADVFLRDRWTGVTERVSLTAGGAQVNGGSYQVAADVDARYIAFQSAGTNLVAADTNGSPDLFVRDRGEVPWSRYCFGDGSGTACPCGNAGGPLHGCGNGTFHAGAALGASGLAGVTADSLVLTVVSSVPGQSGLFLQGINAVGGGNGVLFGDGLRCAGGGLVRLQVRFANASGSASTTVSIALAGGVAAGDVRRYQWWYRDPASSPCANGFNLSNGLEITWVP